MMNSKSYIIAVALLIALISPSYGSLRRLSKASGKSRDGGRRLVDISFNNKYCVTYQEGNWLTPYSGDYEYYGIINAKPAYRMTTCRYSNSCKNGMTLSIGTDGKWYFNGQPSGTGYDPHCENAGDTPSDCTKWWDSNFPQPQITACGNTQTADNGVSQEETDKQNACKNAQNAQKRNYLTQADKDELLRQFNVQRAIYGQTAFTWSSALEAVAQATADKCSPGHPLSYEEAVPICEQNGGGDKCGLFVQGGGGPPRDNVNVYLWDGYKNGDCIIDSNKRIVEKGQVWGLMQDDHRKPMTGEEGALSSVACAYSSCGYMACNYF